MPTDKPNKPAVDKKQAIFLKDLLLKRSDTFCMIPWVHMHTTPTGQGAPCCIANSCADNVGVGNSNRSIFFLFKANLYLEGSIIWVRQHIECC